MYKEAKGVVTSYLLYLWLLLLVTLCILLSSEASTYFNSNSQSAAVQMRARPYYVSPRPAADSNVEMYPVPPRAVSSYAAPLVVMSADYQATPANVPPATYKSVLSTNSDPEFPRSNNNEEIDTSSSNYSENNTDVYDVTQVSLVPEVDTTYSSDETTYWILETSHGDVPYEGTTHSPIYLPALTSTTSNS